MHAEVAPAFMSDPTLSYAAFDGGSCSDEEGPAPPKLVISRERTVELGGEDEGSGGEGKSGASRAKRGPGFGRRTEAAARKKLFSATTFAHPGLKLAERLAARLAKDGFTAMTRIQKEAVPAILRGADVLIRCQTGSGKTLAYLVPCVQRILDFEAANGPVSRAQGTLALLLGPTRELVLQTLEVAERLTTPFPRIVVSAVCGGEKRKSEKARLRKGITLLGATVGRLCDHLDTTAAFRCDRLMLLVLDEADRLLDMNGDARLRLVKNRLMAQATAQAEAENYREGAAAAPPAAPPAAAPAAPLQTVLVSATLSPAIEKLADFLLRKECRTWVDVDGDGGDGGGDGSRDAGAAGGGGSVVTTASGGKLSLPPQLRQFYCVISLKRRLVTTAATILQRGFEGKLIIFLSNCEAVDFHHALFTVLRWPKASAFREVRREAAVAAARATGTAVARLRGPVNTPEAKRIARKFARGEDVSKDLAKAHRHRKAPRAGSSSESESASSSDDAFSSDEDDGGDSALAQARAQLELHLGGAMFPSFKFFKLHGDMCQADRAGNLADFNKAKNQAVLFATDCGARGLNFEAVTWVVQADPPPEVAEYVHRVGRTARIGRPGSSLLFLQEHELGYAKFLEKSGINLHAMSELEIFQSLVQDHLPEDLRRKKSRSDAAQAQELPSFINSIVSRIVMTDVDLLHLARRSYTSSVRAYRMRPSKGADFDAAKLHIGHLGSAMGLTEAPRRIAIKCAAGARAAAARQVLAQYRGAVDATPPSKPTRSNQRFSSVADGLLHNTRKQGLAATLTPQEAHQLLLDQQQGRRAGKRSAATQELASVA